MVKTKSSFSLKLNQIIKSNNDFTTDGQKLNCVVCDKNINVTEKNLKNRVDDHFNSDIHEKNKWLKSQKGDHLSQSLIRNAFNKSEEKEKVKNIFNNELTLALVDSNILCINSIIRLLNNFLKYILTDRFLVSQL